jgi:Tol biopolymer transport system component
LTELQQELSSGSLQAPFASPSARSNAWRSAAIGTAVAIAVILTAGYTVWTWRTAPTGSAIPRNVSFEQLTTQSGVERYPSLSPDGKWVVYEGNQAGNADIYLQSVGGQNPINLTKDSPDDDREPAFSPDGELIAFRSSRQGGGIFVMGRTGESVRRLTDRGYNPAWSPDGTKIVYGTDDATVEGRSSLSELWTVTLATGEMRKTYDGDAVQPNWSPNGLRIAYWRAFGQEQSGQRDIATIPAEGGAPVLVTADAAVDWSPVWSRDGRFLFFSSDRGGSMNLWRLPIDERTGVTLGPPEPLSAPASSAALISLPADGRSTAYTSFNSNSTIQSAAFDPATGSIRGAPVTVIGGSRPFGGPSPSPDGRWLAFHSTAPQWDIFVSRADGTGIRQLTNDRANDRNPGWSPDGSQITFMSNRDGKYQIWSIKPDGSGLRRLTAANSGAQGFNQWSPDGSKLPFQPTDDQRMFFFDPRVDWDQQTPTRIENVSAHLLFSPWSWSPDGTELAGDAQLPDRPSGPLVVYSLATGRFTRLYESGSSRSPLWLNDGRRLLFLEESKVMLIDRVSHATRELMSVAPDSLDGRWSITRDNRTIFLERHIEQADIWLMRLK